MRSTHSETYKGTVITIATTRDRDGWTSDAIYSLLGEGEVRLKPTERGYASEDEARRAALQAAVENIDRARSSIGKP
jgi:hypothetical protein